MFYNRFMNETVCKDYQTESAPMINTDNMGREIFWQD